MSVRDLKDITPIKGTEGTIIKQIFYPHNTLDGIRFSIAHFTLEPKKRSLKHKLESGEVYFILNGTGLIHIEDKNIKVVKNQSIYIPPMTKQYIENIGETDLEFLCIVDPAWRVDQETILE